MNRPPSVTFLRPPSPSRRGRPRPRPHQRSSSSGITYAARPSLSLTTPTTSEQSFHNGRKRIPPDKIQKAAELYKDFRMKEGLAQRSPDTSVISPSPSSTGSYLQNYPRPPSSPSQSSRGQTLHSFNDALTDISSVMSFDSQSSRKPKRKNESISYSGQTVAQRVRKRFDPVGKAKTALIRYLGACAVCKAKGISCSLDHHDIERLERVLEPKPEEQQEISPYDIQEYTGDVASGQSTPVITKNLNNDALRGIGFSFTDAELPSEIVFSPTAGDPFLDIPAPSQVIHDYSGSQPADQATLVEDYYSSFQNGSQFPLGSWYNNVWNCAFFGGSCPETFLHAEDLQLHFEDKHFPFTRITPYYRNICTNCFYVNACLTPCKSCFHEVRVNVCGNYIRDPSYPPEPPNRQPSPLPRSDDTSLCYGGIDFYADFESDLGMNSNDSQYIADETNVNMYDDGGAGIYPNTSTTTSNQYAYDSTQPGGDRYRRYSSSISWRANDVFTTPNRHHCSEPKQNLYRQKLLIVASTLLLLLVFGLWTYDSLCVIVCSFAEVLIPSIPALGFISMVVSFLLCWSAKYMKLHRMKRHKPPHCPLHSGTPFSTHCKQILPRLFAHASRIS
ncbi:hypothetical protein ACMFMF_011505 [Clarireedia jacksonii]